MRERRFLVVSVIFIGGGILEVVAGAGQAGRGQAEREVHVRRRNIGWCLFFARFFLRWFYSDSRFALDLVLREGPVKNIPESTRRGGAERERERKSREKTSYELLSSNEEKTTRPIFNRYGHDQSEIIS